MAIPIDKLTHLQSKHQHAHKVEIKNSNQFQDKLTKPINTTPLENPHTLKYTLKTTQLTNTKKTQQTNKPTLSQTKDKLHHPHKHKITTKNATQIHNKITWPYNTTTKENPHTLIPINTIIQTQTQIMTTPQTNDEIQYKSNTHTQKLPNPNKPDLLTSPTK